MWSDLAYISPSLKEAESGTQGRNLETGAKVGGLEGLSGLLSVTSSSYANQDQCAGIVPPTWAGPYYINHQSRKCPLGMLTG